MHIAGHTDNTVSGKDPNANTNAKTQNIGLLNQLTPEEYRQVQLMLQQRDSQDGRVPPPPQEKKGIFKKLGEKLTDPVVLTGLATAFDSMTTNPSPQLQQRYAAMQQAQRQNQYANQTVQYLRNQGEEQLAGVVETNPTMAQEVLKTFTTQQAGTNFSPKPVGTIQIDQETGGMFTVEYNPNAPEGQRFKRVNITGSEGLTEKQKSELRIKELGVEADQNSGFERGEELFKQFSIVNQQIADYRQIGYLADEGAKTGFIDKYLPFADANTVELRQIANKMGINIINSATFGALSATELRLALSTGFNQNLQGQELQDFVSTKVAAQTKLRDQLLSDARMLLGGSGLKKFADYQQEQIDRHRAAEWSSDLGVDRLVWDNMNIEQREEFIELGNQ